MAIVWPDYDVAWHCNEEVLVEHGISRPDYDMAWHCYEEVLVEHGISRPDYDMAWHCYEEVLVEHGNSTTRLWRDLTLLWGSASDFQSMMKTV
jgi:hypothetical protein